MTEKQFSVHQKKLPNHVCGRQNDVPPAPDDHSPMPRPRVCVTLHGKGTSQMWLSQRYQDGETLGLPLWVQQNHRASCKREAECQRKTWNDKAEVILGERSEDATPLALKTEKGAMS